MKKFPEKTKNSEMVPLGGRGHAVDARAVSEARSGTGKIIHNENEVGGWPDYKPGSPPVCSAKDGIPDEWKKAHGLALNDPNAANAVNAEGCTALEMYLNSLAKLFDASPAYFIR